MVPLICLLLAQNELSDQAKVRAFADHLYEQDDYGAALNEYRRYFFLAGSADGLAHERIIDCLTRLARYEEALAEAGKIEGADRRAYTRGSIFFLAGAMDSARACLTMVDVPYRDDARRLIGLAYASEYRFDEAAHYIAMPAQAPRRKEPVLGGLLSVLPGAGHAYAGRWGDGLYSLLVIGTGALLSYYYHDRGEDVKFAFTLGTTLLFYGGNIYGGVNAVRIYNRAGNRDHLEQVWQMNPAGD